MTTKALVRFLGIRGKIKSPDDLLLRTSHDENIFKIWKNLFPLLLPCLRLSYAVLFAVKGCGQLFQWAGSSDMCLLSSQHLYAIRNALWYLTLGLCGPWGNTMGLASSAYNNIKATANKQHRVRTFANFCITNNRTNWGKRIIFVFQERNYSVVSVGDNFQGLRTNCLHSAECLKIFSEKQSLILLLSLQEAISKLGCQVIPLKMKTYKHLIYRHYLVILPRPVNPYIGMK